MSNKKTVKVTLSLSIDMYERIVAQSKALDTTPNQILKQCAVAYLNNIDIKFLSSEHRLAIKEFNTNQLRLLTSLNKVAELTDKGEELEVNKIRQTFRYFKEDFELMMEKLNGQ